MGERPLLHSNGNEKYILPSVSDHPQLTCILAAHRLSESVPIWISLSCFVYFKMTGIDMKICYLIQYDRIFLQI